MRGLRLKSLGCGLRECERASRSVCVLLEECGLELWALCLERPGRGVLRGGGDIEGRSVLDQDGPGLECSCLGCTFRRYGRRRKRWDKGLHRMKTLRTGSDREDAEIMPGRLQDS